MSHFNTLLTYIFVFIDAIQSILTEMYNEKNDKYRICLISRIINHTRIKEGSNNY